MFDFLKAPQPAPPPPMRTEEHGPSSKPTATVPAAAHQPTSASPVGGPSILSPNSVNNGLSWLSSAASNTSAGIGLGQSAPATVLSGHLGATGHILGAIEKGRAGDNTGMGLKGLSALGSLTGMLAPRMGMAMQAPEHIRDIASGDANRAIDGVKGLASLHPIGAISTYAHMHPRTIAAAKAQGPGFLEGTKTDGPFGSYVDMKDPFGGHGF